MKARDQLRETLAGVTFAKLIEDESCCMLQGSILPAEENKHVKQQ
jgi:hypothetical protein